MSVESLASPQPFVLILMGTFNGEKYIQEQLDSIASQTHQNWKLVISDDGSTDQTLELAKKWASEVGADRVEFRSGPQKGFAQNFLSMACDSNLHADFYAFCDQDDVWERDKLSIALNYVTHLGSENKAFLYCGRTEYVNDRLETLGNSTLYLKPPDFKNALVQSLAGGNTMVFNKPLKHALECVGVVPAISHDWWLYQLTCGMNGNVFYDFKALVLYRQHPESMVGRNTGFAAGLKRLQMVFNGELRRYTDQNIESLERAEHFLGKHNKRQLHDFKSLRFSSFFGRFFRFLRLGIYRQTFWGQVALTLFVLTNKL